MIQATSDNVWDLVGNDGCLWLPLFRLVGILRPYHMETGFSPISVSGHPQRLLPNVTIYPVCDVLMEGAF